ncbi:MAG: hypothetical protein C5S38_02255 [Candidatus Methanophagaceae archaeon]|jgi:hypothetical protein|nr:MAG: hypothetical protein C5S38_02255 [Methanophagales archaeon]
MKAKEFIEVKMKRAEQFLFKFSRAYAYTFIAGILVSLTVNLFTTALLTESLPISVYRVYGIASSLFMSSIGAFGVSALLESARSEWESAGSPRDPEIMRDFIEKRKRIRLMLFFFAIMFVGPILFILLV